MKNERDIEFTPSPALDSMTQGVDFTPETGTTTSGTSATGNLGASGTTGTTGGYGAGGTTGTTGGYGASGSTGTTGTEGQGSQQSQGDGPLGQAKDRAQQLMSTAQERVTGTVQSKIDAQRHRAADTLTEVAQSLRGTTQQINNDGISQYVNQAADRVEDLAHYLHDRELSEIVDQVEDFARRQPAAFLGGAFALGVLGARFLKSSQRGTMARHEMRERWSTEELTSRVYDPERDAVSRPNAPGYAPPQERGDFM